MIKRIIDIIASIILLLLLSPVMIVLSALIYFLLGTPILFRQQRPGIGGKSFTILKFSTMTNDIDKNGNLLPDGMRLTSFGKFIRKTSLDELPELFNVLKGEMSLVGPRPLLMQYLPRYSSEQMRRHVVKPGITGWAQINGRNSISHEEKFKLDVWYVDNHTLVLDIKIILITIFKILMRKDIKEPNHLDNEEFKGNKT